MRIVEAGWAWGQVHGGGGAREEVGGGERARDK